MSSLPRGTAVRRDAGLHGYERALQRAGFLHVAGADEAGRGACAGPLVVAAVVLPPGRSAEIDGLADSKLLSAAQRERVYARVMRRAVATSVIVVPPADVDALGLHVMNLQAMRRAVRRLSVTASYVLSDGFPVPGLEAPSLAMWKGDRVAGCVAAASVVAKVTRDRIMDELDAQHPGYGFGLHKGYCTKAHDEALAALGPSPVHRYSYVNVARAAGLHGRGSLAGECAVPVRTLVRLAAGDTARNSERREASVGKNEPVAQTA